MAGTIKVDSINADSNLALKIANTAVAFIDATGLRPTSGNVNLDATATSKLYLPSANTVAIQTAGVTAVTVDSSQNVTLAAALAVTGVTTVQAGTAALPAITTTGETNTGIFVPPADTIAFSEGGAEAMRIDSSGNLGIGTNSPSYRLDVVGAGSPANGIVRASSNLNNNSTKYGYYTVGHYTNSVAPFGFIQGESNSTENNVHIGSGAGETTAATRIDFYTASNNTTTGGTERMRIDSTGEVLIGATAAAQTADGLFVKGKRTATSNQWNFQVYTTAGQATFTCRDDYYFRSMGIYDRTAGGAANITIDGSGYLYRSTSSIKYKRDVTNYDKGIAEVMQLRPVYYKSKVNDPDGNQINTQFAGLIAEELDEIGLDEFVVKDKDGEVEAIHYGNMVALLTKAIQELKALNDTQAETINALTANLTALTARITALESTP